MPSRTATGHTGARKHQTGRIGRAPRVALAAVCLGFFVIQLLVGGTVILGMCSLAMPAMTAVVVGSAGREHAGVASGVLNTARQAGGALGVALLGSLLVSGGRGAQALTLHTPLIVSAAGLLIAVCLAWVATHRS